MASYGYTFNSGDSVTPTRLNAARTVSDIVNADISASAAIVGTKIAPNFGAQDITVSTADRSITNTGNFALSFGTNNTERLRIDASGNVGIGTSLPSVKLDVNGGIASSSAAPLHIKGNDFKYLTCESSHLAFYKKSGAYDFYFRKSDDGTQNGSNAVELMIIKDNGNVGVGTTPSYKLHVNGSVAGVGAYNDVSDAREKQNISYDFQHGLQTVRELKPAHFDYLGDGPQNNLGFIAQDIQQVLPGMVTTFNKTVGEGDEATTEERLAIKEANLIAVLVKAVQELDTKVAALEAAQ